MAEGRVAVLVTRPEPGASQFAETLRQGTDFQVFAAPLLTIVPARNTPVPADDADALLITSPQALGYAEHLRHLPVYAVGVASAAAARAAGFEVRAEGPGSADERLASRVPAGTRLLHPSGVHTARDLAPVFAAHGVDYRRIPVYEARAAGAMPPEIDEFLCFAGEKVATFLSARTAEIFGRHVRERGLPGHTSDITALCASDRIARAAQRAFPFREAVVTGTTEPACFVDFVTSRRT